jgi:hypothetical protein
MCMFCAAVPAVIASSAALDAKQKAARRADTDTPTTAESVSLPRWAASVPVVPVTTVIVGGLIVGSVVAHSGIRPT